MDELLKRLNKILLALRNWAIDLVAWVGATAVALVRVAYDWFATLVEWVKKLLEYLAQKKQATKIEFWSEGKQIGGSGMANETQLHNNKKKHIELLFKDDAGVERPVDGLPDIKGPVPEGICNVQLDDNHLGFMLFGLNADGSGGPTGDVTMTVTADVDKGEGFKPLTEELVVHVVEPEAPQATDIEFKAGDELDL